MNHVIIEIKAQCKEQDRIREILSSRKADFKGTDHQIDTYFRTARGRLKLREGEIENHLIFYARKDEKGPKQSDVALFDTKPNSPLKEILGKSLGVLVVVDKRRDIYFIDNVKFHIDTVKDLGTFVEIEAIDKEGTIDRNSLQEQCREYLALLGIKEEDLISDSYSDMLLEKCGEKSFRH